MFSQMLIWPVGMSPTDTSGAAPLPDANVFAAKRWAETLRQLGVRAGRALVSRLGGSHPDG